MPLFSDHLVRKQPATRFEYARIYVPLELSRSTWAHNIAVLR